MSQAVYKLTNLEELALSHNSKLAISRQLSALCRLRCLDLRATGLRDYPPGMPCHHPRAHKYRDCHRCLQILYVHEMIGTCGGNGAICAIMHRVNKTTREGCQTASCGPQLEFRLNACYSCV
jgi:hypothetical protein